MATECADHDVVPTENRSQLLRIQGICALNLKALRGGESCGVGHDGGHVMTARERLLADGGAIKPVAPISAIRMECSFL